MKNESLSSASVTQELDAKPAVDKASAEMDTAPTFTEVTQNLVILIKPTAVEPARDKDKKIVPGKLIVKFWIEEEVKDGDERRLNSQIIRATSDFPLEVGVEHLVVASIDFDANPRKKSAEKGGGFFLADKKISRVQIKSLYKKSR
ncbi:MAG: hypothetical protein EOO46_05970 [Flavobacterium sp.]|nr:MAG: hypothetical protein EOO46_05970 [Flavobacterium sp.]